MATLPFPDQYADVSNAYDILVRRSGRVGPGAPATPDEGQLRAAINHWADLTDEARESAVALARRVLTPVVRVEVGSGDDQFLPSEVAEILALVHSAQRHADGLMGVVYRREDAPATRLAKLLREAVQELPVPNGCTGYWDEFSLIEHDGDTCPVHELGDGEEESD